MRGASASGYASRPNSSRKRLTENVTSPTSVASVRLLTSWALRPRRFRASSRASSASSAIPMASAMQAWPARRALRSKEPRSSAEATRSKKISASAPVARVRGLASSVMRGSPFLPSIPSKSKDRGTPSFLAPIPRPALRAALRIGGACALNPQKLYAVLFLCQHAGSVESKCFRE